MSQYIPPPGIRLFPKGSPYYLVAGYYTSGLLSDIKKVQACRGRGCDFLLKEWPPDYIQRVRESGEVCESAYWGWRPEDDPEENEFGVVCP